jgi:uncharacterized protein (TIGR03437 family)
VLAKPILPVSVGYETLYIGAAPGLVAGVLQINLRLPQYGGIGLTVVVGGISSDLVPDAPIIYTTQ